MEENTIKKLKKLVKVSEELTFSQMAEFLGIDEKSLNEHIVDWADEFGFTLNKDVVKFGSCYKDALESLRRDLKQVVKEEKEFVIYDADKADEEGKKMLDTWRVADMPIIQIVDDDGKIHYQFPFVDQGMSPRSINHMISQKEKDLKKIP